jgi:hypothetical protein
MEALPVFKGFLLWLRPLYGLVSFESVYIFAGNLGKLLFLKHLFIFTFMSISKRR